MYTLLQRVRSARVEVHGAVVGQIAQGLLVLLCAEQGDTEQQADKLLAKLLKIRIFSDAEGKMNRSVQDVQGGLLLVSQFTLAGRYLGRQLAQLYPGGPCRRRPAFVRLCGRAGTKMHPNVATGVFAADMQVHLINDGPVTIPLRIAPPGAASSP